MPDWRQDEVYLAQFPPSPRVRSISPFSLKLETWLRLAQIPYKNVYTRKFSRASHTIPYIELNGQQISDSNRILETLRSQFQVEVDPGLTAKEKAADHAVTSMIENHTTQVRLSSQCPQSSVKHQYKFYLIISPHYLQIIELSGFEGMGVPWDLG